MKLDECELRLLEISVEMAVAAEKQEIARLRVEVAKGRLVRTAAEMAEFYKLEAELRRAADVLFGLVLEEKKLRNDQLLRRQAQRTAEELRKRSQEAAEQLRTLAREGVLDRPNAVQWTKVRSDAPANRS